MEKIVIVESPGVKVYSGTILELKEGEFVTISYKQPRRPKPSERTIMWNDVITVSGTKGEVGSVTTKSPSAVVMTGKGDVKKIGPTCVTAVVNGETVSINPANGQVSAFIDKTDGDAPATSKKGGKKAKPEKSGKTKKKKK
jgi:hypothetical protein